MLLRQPLVNRRRQKEPGLAVNRPEVAHRGNILEKRSKRALILSGPPHGVKSDRLLDGTEERFRQYIDRELVRISASSRKPMNADYLLKYGPSANHWNEYIFLAYVNHQTDAIFLAGIPDIRESLPQA